MNLILAFLQDLAKNAASKAAPFALGEIPAMIKFFTAYASSEIDFIAGKITSEEAGILRNQAISDLKDFIAACEAEGVEIATDLAGIFMSAGADTLMGAFGFNQASA